MRIGSVRFRNRLLAIPLFISVLAMSAPSLPAQDFDLGKTRRLAEAQHEIVILHFKKKEFTKALEEANTIFQMKWPDDQEPVLLKELRCFSDLFRHNLQYDLALRLLETNLGIFKTTKSKSAIWMDKGYVLEEMGQPDRALQCFREAKRLLEGKDPRL
jgi:tetratricopeptide (TPR) repeat protein